MHTDGSAETLKVLCSEHGVVQDDVADRIAASVIKEDHESDCPGEVRIGDDDGPDLSELGVRKADAVVLEDDANHCPACLRRLYNQDETCPRCGLNIRWNDGD